MTRPALTPTPGSGFLGSIGCDGSSTAIRGSWTSSPASRLIVRSPMADFELPTSVHVSREHTPPEVEQLGLLLETAVEVVADTIAVLDATNTPDAVLVGLSCGTLWGVQVAADRTDRVRGLIFLGPQVPLAPTHPDRTVYPFAERLDTTEGWAKYNRYYWLEGGYRDFLEFFARQGCTEPHSTKQIEDIVEWALDIEPATLVASDEGLDACGLASFRSVCQRVRAPVLVIHGDGDELAHHARGEALATVTGGELVTVAGGGHFSKLASRSS